MNKKLLVSVLFFLFIFSSVTLVKGAQKIEHLVWAHPGRDYSNSMENLDPNSVTSFEFDPMLTFSVPPSPGSKALFFEAWAKVNFEWSNYLYRKAEFYVVFQLISNVIPGNIEVYVPFSVYVESENNTSGNSSPHVSRDRYVKLILKKNSDYFQDYWFITYKNSGEYVSNDKAIRIVRKLIERGFDVEVYTVGKVQGINSFTYSPITMQVTRLSQESGWW